MDVQFIRCEAALKAGDSLVIADLHIGIEHEYRQSGIRMPSQTSAMEQRLEALLWHLRAKSLLICGDLKHKVPGLTYQEEREVPAFLSRFLKQATIEIVQGNHDADLRTLLPEGVVLHPPAGVLRGDLYLTHGHTWPSPSFLQARHIVMGHIQPQVDIRDLLGYAWREPVWVRSPLDAAAVASRYGLSKRLPDLIILPSFNRMAGGVAIDRLVHKPTKRRLLLKSSPPSRAEKARLSPLLKLANLKEAEVFLLDGTFLGELGKL